MKMKPHTIETTAMNEVKAYTHTPIFVIKDPVMNHFVTIGKREIAILIAWVKSMSAEALAELLEEASYLKPKYDRMLDKFKSFEDWREMDEKAHYCDDADKLSFYDPSSSDDDDETEEEEEAK